MQYYTAIIGFLMMGIVTYLLIKKKVNTLFAFAVIPIFGAILLGFNLTEITGFVKSGLGKTSDMMLAMFFSLPFFSVMSEAAVFDIMVDWLLKHTKLSCVAVTLVTILVSLITELDGSVTSTFLITIPMLLPLYKKLKMDPKILVFLCCSTMCALFVTPWNARTLRAATLLPKIDAPQNYIFSNMLPMMLIYIGILVVFAIVLAKNEERKGAGVLAPGESYKDIETKLPPLARPKYFWINMALIVILIISISATKLPMYFSFAVGLIIALMINYPDLKLQGELMKKYSASLYATAAAVLLAGVVVGVLQESGMVDAMVSMLLIFIPNALGPYVYIIIALLATPLMLLFTNDVWLYVLVPIIMGISSKYNIAGDVVIFTLMMNLGAMISPVAQPQLYLACDLAEIDIADHVKYTFKKIWLLSILWTVIGFAIGTFR